MRTISDYNPISVAVYFLAVAGIAMFCMDGVILSLSLFGAVLFYLVKNGRKNAKLHLYSFLLFSGTVLINPLVSHNGKTVLFVINHSPVTLEALIYGIAAGGMVVSVLYWFGMFTQIMTADKLLYLFGAFSPKLSLMLSMALRYVPLFGKQAKRVDMSQKALGLYREESLPDNIRGKTRIFSVMVTWALENGIVTADSMAARGYGLGKRSRYSVFAFRGRDALLLCLSALLFGLTLFGIKDVEFTFYPETALRGLDAMGYVGYGAYGLLAVLPTVIEWKEALRWKYLRSKI